MALVTRLMTGFYVDGICEVFAVYDDKAHILKEIVVKGDMDRVVDVVVDGELIELGKHRTSDFKLNQSARNLRFFISPDDTPSETPNIVCTFYAQKLSRDDVIANKLAAIEK